MLADSGIVYTLLRTAGTAKTTSPAPRQHWNTAYYRCGGRWQNRLSNAGRLCGTAARVISEAGHEGKVYELAGIVPGR